MHFGAAAWPRGKLKMSVKSPASCSSNTLSTSLEISFGIAALQHRLYWLRVALIEKSECSAP